MNPGGDEPSDHDADQAARNRPLAVQTLLDGHFPTAKDDVGEIDIVSCGDGAAVVRLPYQDRFARPGGTVSGPTMFKLADIACYVALLDELGAAGIDAVTVTMTINFLARPAPGDLTCRVSTLRRGRRQAVYDVRIFGASNGQMDGLDDATLVAHASCIYALPKR